MDEHRSEFGVESICRRRPIAPSVYCEQKARQGDSSLIAARQRLDAVLHEDAKRVHRESGRLDR